MDIPEPLWPPLPIIHCFRQVLRSTSRIGTEPVYVGSRWSSCLCSSMWRDPHEYLLLQQCPACLVRLILIVFMMGGWWPYSCSFVGVLPPGLVQYCSQHSLYQYKIEVFVTYKLVLNINILTLNRANTWTCSYQNKNKLAVKINSH